MRPIRITRASSTSSSPWSTSRWCSGSTARGVDISCWKPFGSSAASVSRTMEALTRSRHATCLVLGVATGAGVGLDGSEEAAWSRRWRPTSTTSGPPTPGRCAAATSMPPSVWSPDCASTRSAGSATSSRAGRRRRSSCRRPSTTLSIPSSSPRSAYGHFVRGDLAAAIEVGHRPPRPRPAPPASASPNEPSATPSSTSARTDEALAWMDRMVDSARSGGSPSRLAHALYMRSVAETSVGRTVRGAVLAGEAHATARAAPRPPRWPKPTMPSDSPSKGPSPLESGRLLREAALAGAPATGGSRRSRDRGLVARGPPRRHRSRRLPASALSSKPGTEAVTGPTCGSPCATSSVSCNRSAITGLRQSCTAHSSPPAPTTPCHSNLRDAEHLVDIVEQVHAQLGPKTFDQAATMAPRPPNPSSSPTSSNASPI